jgi:hypothetical protein
MPQLRTRLVPLLAVAAVLGPAPASLAWGPRAHRVATRVAEARLTPAARSAVRALLHEGDNLVSECNWADNEGHDAVPGSAAWHFVNVPITAARYDDRYCRGGGCVVAKIRHYRTLVADRRAPKAERARALLFLVHFVEDVHQPLHVGDNRDRGGNLTQVQFLGRATNLHRLWDSQLIEDEARDERALTESVARLATPENVARWSRGGVEAWADESLQEAKRAYHFPPGSALPNASGVRLGRDYAEFATPVIRLRLAQAGVRLANELNAAFDEAGQAGGR